MSSNPYFDPKQPMGQRPPGPQTFGESPPARSKLPWVIAAVLGGVFILGVLICCGGGYAVMNLGMSVVAEDIRMQLRDDPIVQEQIGEIREIDVDFGASIAHEDDETFIYRVKGSKADGELTVKSVTRGNDSEEIISASLRTDDGQTFELRP